MKFKVIFIFIFIILITVLFNDVQAQCAMCKEVVTSGTQNGSDVGKGINTGVLYMLAFPLLAVSTVAWSFWKRWKAAQK